MKRKGFVAAGLFLLAAAGCIPKPSQVDTNPAVKSEQRLIGSYHDQVESHAKRMLEEGRSTFRNETFGSEQFWGDRLRLHHAIAGEKYGGFGPGLQPVEALKLGLKVDLAALPSILKEALRGGAVSLTNVKTTLELLKADAVVGVRGIFEGDKLVSIGITCALCHSTVDDSFLKGIGRRLDGWPNRDLDVGAIVALAPDLTPYQQLLGADRPAVEKVLKSWGPGRYDAELNMDGKAFRPDGKTSATLLPAAFGLAGVNLHTYSGWGSVTYWNAYVANTQMMGKGVFFDPRIGKGKDFPVAQKAGFANLRNDPDLVTSKLAALHYYQLSLPAPKPVAGSFDEIAAGRGKKLFSGKAGCARCHVPPLYTEPGWSMHSPEEIGIDSFQADRSPDRMYRTTPLAGLFVRVKGGFYHDGRFPDYRSVIDHYDRHFSLKLSGNEKLDLVEFLKSL